MGKKSKRRGQQPPTGARPTAEACPIDVVAHLLKQADEQSLPIEHFFLGHEHRLGSCDGDGAYNIISLFRPNPSILPPGSTVSQFSIITTICLRCHDNVRNTVFLPVDMFQSRQMRELTFGNDGDDGAEKSAEDYYNDYVDLQRNNAGCGFQPAPYRLCAQLVAECLVRMKRRKKVLEGKEERTVARLFGLESTNPSHRREVSLPPPAPAPSVKDLWITLNRPEYYFFQVSEDLGSAGLFAFGEESGPITHESLEKSLDCIVEDEYRRERLLAMLEHMALWHALGNEREVASWLLCERASMMGHAVDDPRTINAMKSNVVLQLMVNKAFDSGCEDLAHPIFPQLGEYGKGISCFFYYRQHMEMTGSLPPNYIVTASIAKSTDGSANKSNGQVGGSTVEQDICNTIKYLKFKRSECALCGATRSTNGGELSSCSICESVGYCCREHQKLHWKKGGHKQECSKQ